MEQQPGQRLGELLVDRGYLSPIDLELVLRIQNGAQRQADGKKRDDTRVSNLIEIALKKGHLKQEQLKHATVLQARSLQDGFVVPLDEILLNKGYLRREHYLEIIKQQGEQGLGVNIPGYDRYELIGYGGMGAVYKARQISMDRPVAIKVLSERFRDKPRYRERFLREARNVAKLNHENIIAGYDFGESGSVSYFVMEFVEGRTCEELLQERRRLDDREAAEIVLQVGRALQHAFEKGMIHRDIKPENIMITAEDRKVKLCDLGLAWSADELDEGGKGFGTPNYMSPEQIRGQTLDIRTDIYSLGVTLYRMLFGKLPFHGASPMVTMSKHLNEPLQFPDETMSPLQRALSAVIARMLAKHPNERHQDPSMLVRELEGILDRLAAPATTAPIAAVPPPAAQPPVAEEDPRAPRKRRSASARLRRGRRR
jgi:serine/threonine-protein kinase